MSKLEDKKCLASFLSKKVRNNSQEARIKGLKRPQIFDRKSVSTIDENQLRFQATEKAKINQSQAEEDEDDLERRSIT